MSIVDDILREAQRIAARRGNSGRTQAELNRIQSVKENTKAAAKKKKKKKVSNNSNQKEEKKETSAESRRIDRVSRYRGGDKATSATSPDARFDSLNLSSVRPANKGADTQRTQAERDRRQSVKENRMATDAEKVSDDVRYNPLIRRPVEMHEDTSPEINNLAEALTRKYFQGFEGAFVGHSDQRNAQIAEDYLTGEYKNRYNPLTKAPVDMQMEDPEKVKRAEEQAKSEGYDSLEEWEIAKANKQMSKNDDFYERKAALDTNVANQKYGTLGNTLTEVAEVIGSMTPTIAAGYLGGAVVGALGLTGKAAWLMQNIVSGAEIGNRVAGQETKYLYDRLVEETKMINGGQQLSIEEYEDSIHKASTAAELVGLAEAGTEMLFGGLDFLGKGLLDDVVTKLGWNMLSNETKQVLRVWRDSTPGRIISEVVKRSGGAIGEGMEEAIMSIVQPVIETNVADVESKVTLENIAKDFGLGAAVSLVVGVPVSVASSTGVVMDAIAEKKSNKEFINAIKNRADELVKEGIITNEEYSSTIAEVEDIFAGKGSLNVPDTQEEVKISGEALDTVYDSYEDAKKAMMQEARTKKDGEKVTANYIDNGVVKTFTTNAKGGTLGLGRSVEAGKEYQRIAQAKNATERSGYQLNVKEEIINEVSSLSKAIGREVEFYRNGDATDHGYMNKKTGKIYVNADSSQSAARSVIAHELTHQMENTAGWKGIVELMKKHYGSSYESRRQERIDAYEAFGKPLKVDKTRKTYDEADQELVAMFVEEKLLTDADTIREVVNTDKTLAQKIIAWINKVIQKLAGSKEQKMLVEARDLWNQALQEEKSGKVKPRTIEEEVTDDAGVENVEESYDRYSINVNTYNYAMKRTVEDEATRKKMKVIMDSLKELSELQGYFNKNRIRNIHNINQYFHDNPDVWQKVIDIQNRSIEAGVIVNMITPIQDTQSIEGKLVQAGLIGIPIEYVDKPAESKSKKTYKFEAFQRRLPQFYFDSMNPATREEFRKEFVKAVEHAYEAKIEWENPVKGMKEYLPGKKELSGVVRQSKAGTVESKNLKGVQPALRKAEKTIAALNLNSACPMFSVGNNGCYLDACYLTQMAMGANGVNLFKSAMYSGEILQLSQADIDRINDRGGLRVNGIGDTIVENRGQFYDIIKHSCMRGLKLKIITKQKPTLSILQEIHDAGYDISKAIVQPSMDNLWIPATLDDIYGAGVRGTTGIANTVAKGTDTALEAAANAYDSVFGRATKVVDGVLYRKYGFSPQQIADMRNEFPDVQVVPRYVVCTAKEIAELALNKNNLFVNNGKLIQTLMHGKVPEGCFSDYEGEIINFGSARHVVEKDPKTGKWDFYGMQVSKGNEHRRIESKTKTPHEKVKEYVEQNYTEAEQDIIWTNLKEQMCCQDNEFSDACAGCQSLCAGGCAANQVEPKTESERAKKQLKNDLKRLADQAAIKMPEIRRSVGKSEDAEYMDAVESGDMGTAQRLVREAANIAGYTSPKLHHGTKSFGFTQLRTKDLDIFEWSPFFATSDPNLAETYSGETERRQLRGGYPKATQDQIDEHLAEYYGVLKKRIRAIDKHLGKPALPRANDAKRRSLMKDARNELANMVEAQDAKTFSEAYNRYIDNVDALEKTAMLPAEEALFEFDEVHKAQREINRIISAEEVFITSKGKLVTDENKEELEISGTLTDKQLIKEVKSKIDSGYELMTDKQREMVKTECKEHLFTKVNDIKEYVDEEEFTQFTQKERELAYRYIKNIQELAYAETVDDFNKAKDASDKAFFDFNNERGLDIEERSLFQLRGYAEEILYDLLSFDVLYIKENGSYYSIMTPQEARDQLGDVEVRGIYSFYANLDGMLEIDGEGKNWNHIDGSKIGKEGYVKTRDVALYARDNGYKGVIIKNIYDSGGETDYYEPGDIYIFFEPASQVKSADTVTYDDNNEVIPLSERFNEENNDIRWSVGKAETARNYFVGDIVSYLDERATVVERSNPKGGTLTYTIELDNGDRIEVTADQLQVGVTPELHFDELDKDVQRQWKDAPEDWDGLYDDAYTDLDDIEPPKKRGKENPLELDDVRYMLSDYADMLGDPTAEELEMEWAWTKKLTGQGVSFLKDYVRNIEAASNGNKQLEHRLRELFVKPFQKGKSKYVSGVHTMLDELYDKMQELGIQKESTEAAAVIKYGEKKVVTWERWYDPQAKKKVWRSEVKPYTIEDLKKECPNTWENVVEADRWFRDKYDAYIVRINEVRRGIYGHHFQHREMEITTAREKANQHKESRNALETQLYDIEQCLRAKRTQLAVKRNAKDAKVNELEKEIDYNNQYRNTIVDLIEEHKEKEAHYTSLANELEQDLLHGQSWNQKRLKRREDYYHHMREESGFLEDLFMNGRNSEIDPALEGKSVGTKPKAKWSGIFERQGIDPFRYDAVASFIDYIQAAEYAIHMDPVISQFRADIYNIAISTQESRNANKLILWLTNWTNDLSGKTTDHIDRFVQERIGRDNMRRVRKIVSRSKFNAVGINLNSAVAQFGNLPNALAYVQNPQSWGKGLQMYMKWLTKDDAVRRIVKESTFLDERFLDTVMSKFDQRLKDKPEKFASWLLRFGDQHSSFMIWCIAYEDAVRRNKKNPIQIADEITMEAVAGRGVGEVPLQMKSTWTNIIAPFQIEVNNAYQIYKKKVKTMASSKSTKQERVNAGTSFLLLLLGNFVANTISDLLTHRRILFDPIYVLLETIGEWAEGDDEDKNWWDKTRELIGKEIGNIFSNMPYGDLLAYYAFNNEWAREKLFGDYDPTRFGVGNIVLDWGTEFATDLVTGEDIADDLLGFITTFVTPFGGKQLERIVDGLVQEGVLPNIDISTSKLPSIKRQKAPGVYNSKNELQFPVPTFADDPWEAMRAILFGAYTTEYGEKYLGKDRENSKWWENILGWNKIKEQTALSERATAVYNALVADGADPFGIYDTLRNVQNADKTVDKRNALLDAISEGTITEEDALNILLGYMTQKNNVESVNKKITAFTDAGLSVTDYLEVSNLYTMIDNNEEYATAQDRANAFVSELAAAGYTADQINDINDVMKYFSHIPANIDKFADMTAAGLSTETSVKVQNAIAALEPLEGKTSVSELQKAEAIAGLNLSAEEELAAMSLALTESTYTKYKVVSNYGVTAQTWVDFKNALAVADADNNSNGSYDKEEKMAALDSLNVSNETRAALWQTMDNMMYNTEKDTSWKAARNPYSSSVGAAVIDSCIEAKAALQAEKEASGESAYGNPVGFELTEDKISSPYGYRVHPISGKWKMHTGIDIPAKQGEPILAAGAGTVVKVVSSDSGYGNHVIIEHEDGTQTLYAHMYSYGVEEGQTVSKGEQIGEVGSTGTSTGNHLHFEVRVDGKAVNPQSVFDLTGEGIMTSTEYAPLVSGGGSSNGGSSGGRGQSSGSSTASVGSRTSQVASNRQSGGLTLPSFGGSGGNGGSNRSSAPVVGRSTSAPTYGSMGITLPKASDYTPNRRSISSSVATTQRTGRTGGSFWDDNILS